MIDNEATKLDRTWSQKAEQEGTSVAPKFSITGILLPVIAKYKVLAGADENLER